MTAPVLTDTTVSNRWQQGDVFSCTHGSLAISYTYQWYRDSTPIPGQSGTFNGATTTYVPTSADVGHQITCQVTAAATGHSNASGTVTSPPSSFTISLNPTTNVISWNAYPGAVRYMSAVSNGDRTNANRVTTYGNIGTSLSWTPSPVSGQTMYYGVGVVFADNSVVWCDTEVSIAWPASVMAIGCNTGDWGGNTSFGPNGGLTEAQDFAQGGIDWIRAAVDEFPNAADLKNYYLTEALHAIICKAGPYNTGGVTALVGSDNGQSWANAALNLYQTAGVPISRAPVFEVLNEPYGSWFWGSNANSQANAEAYGQLIKTTYTTFHNALGSNCPKIIAATFGNGAGTGQPVGATPSWWTWLHNKHSDIASYYDGVVMHPYGGTGDRTLSGQGDRNGVTSANLATGKPVYVTEVGWPTAAQTGNTTPTGDSLQWTDAEQATNIGNFLNWAKSTGYVAAVMIYHHYDISSPAFYGIIYGSQNTAGTTFRHKPSFAVVGAA